MIGPTYDANNQESVVLEVLRARAPEGFRWLPWLPPTVVVYKRRQKLYGQCVTAETKEQVDDNDIMRMMAKLRTFKSSRFGFPRYHMIQVNQIITLSMSTSDDIETR